MGARNNLIIGSVAAINTKTSIRQLANINRAGNNAIEKLFNQPAGLSNQTSNANAKGRLIMAAVKA